MEGNEGLQSIPIDKAVKSQMKIHVSGPGTIEFLYKKGSLFTLAVIIDIVILFTIMILSVVKLRRLHNGSLLKI